MKQAGAKFEYERERNADLVRAFREQLRLCKNIVLPQLLRKVVNSPSARFWVSEERAATVITLMLKGINVPIRREKKREMYKEIYRRVLAIKVQHPEMSAQQIVNKVVRQPAPQFYLTPESACVILSKIKNGKYNR